jgi:hypothetical protein
LTISVWVSFGGLFDGSFVIFDGLFGSLHICFWLVVTMHFDVQEVHLMEDVFTHYYNRSFGYFMKALVLELASTNKYERLN